MNAAAGKPIRDRETIDSRGLRSNHWNDLCLLRFVASLGGAKRPRKTCRRPNPGSTCLRGLAARATTPLLPDDYLKMLNPLWSARELRGEIVDVRPETADSATVTIKPGWGFSAQVPAGPIRRNRTADRRPMALALVFVDVDPEARQQEHHHHREGHPRGLSVDPPGQRCQTGNHRAAGVPQGRLRAARPGAGKDPVRQAGSGITPVMAMLRTLKSRGQQADIVHIHSAPSADEVIFHDELRELEKDPAGLSTPPAAHRNVTATSISTISPTSWPTGGSARPGRAVRPPCWTPSRRCGKAPDCSDQLHMERFTIAAPTRAARAARSPSPYPTRPSK